MPQDNKIKIRRGLNSSLPAANTEVGELRYSTDTKELYIDDGTNNVKIGGNPLGFPVSTATQTALNLKANLESPALTGTPTAPTASAGTNTTQIATTAFTIANRGDRYLTTSTTSHSLTTGSKTFTVQSGLSYTATQDITIVADVDPVNKHMHGVVTSYSGTTLVVDIQTVNESGGPYTAWTINVGGLLSSEGALYSANNLSDVANTATALTNLGGVPTSRTISAGTGLTGGGNLTADRTLTVAYGTTSGTACEGNDARLSDSRTPSAHAASHASTGSDPLAPSDIGAQPLFTSASQVLSADFTLTSGRATKWTLQNYNGTTYNVTLPTTNIQAGDVVVVAAGTLVGSQTIREANVGGGSFVTLATLSEGQSYRFVSTGTASNSWEIDQVYTHTHAASDITSGTLAHERGGLEADVSAYNGLVKISGGSTSAVTVTSAGEALLDDADAAAQRTTLGLGTAAVEAASAFAQASHGHGNINSSGQVGSDSGRVLVTTTAGAVTTLALGAANQVLRVNSGASGVEFADPASGVTGAAASASDVLGVSGSDITGVDANADRIVFWDDSASALKYLEAGSGLSISGTTLTATASGGSKTYAVFTAEHNQPPSTAFATLDTRNSIAVLDFDDATDESAVFVGIIPEGASLGSGLKIRLHWMATTATSGNVVWDVSLERMTTDLDADSFDTIASGTAAANGTSGILTVTEITLTTIDSVTTGDGFRLKVTRDANNASDTMTGDAELVVCEVRSAA